MKKVLILLLCFVLLISVFSGCSKDNKEPVSSDTPITGSSVPEIPEIEYSDVSALICGDIIGKPYDDFGLSEELVFLTGENLIGYDYVNVGEMSGNLTCYYSESGIYSAIFGSAPYDNQDKFTSAFEKANKLISEKLGVEIKESTYHGGNEDEDKLEALFAGKCVLISEYDANGICVTVTGCGVNDVATVVIECSSEFGGVK